MLSGKLAWVTGAGGGLGRSICQVFSREGATVVVDDVNEQAAGKTLEAIGGTQHFLTTSDVRYPESIKKSLERIKEKYGAAPALVVHAAGVLDEVGDFLSVQEDTYNRVMDTNLKGTFFVNQIAAQAMIDTKVKSGCIVNIASLAARIFPAKFSAYATSKSGVVGLTKVIAKELAPHDITVNSVCPGGIMTNMLYMIPEQILTSLQQANPMNRFAEPSEIAETILHLLSSKNRYLNGAIIDINGGSY